MSETKPMDPTAARALIAEGRRHGNYFWCRDNLAALLDGYEQALAEVERLTAAREADAVEAATTYEAMRDELDHVAPASERDHLSRASRRMVDTVMGDRDALRVKLSDLERVVDELRCGDLSAFHDGELSPERAEAFRLHLFRCPDCADELADMAILDEIASAPPRDPAVPR
jgi:hypothetical protein